MERARLAILCSAITAFASATAADTVLYRSGQPLQFGDGYDSLTGKVVGACVTSPTLNQVRDTGWDPATDAGALAQRAKFEMANVESVDDLSTRLHLTASASAQFGLASASMEMSYLKSQTFNSYNRFLHLHADVTNATRELVGASLDTKGGANSPAMMRRNNPLSFFKRCGDQYVRTITRGGQFDALLEIRTTGSEKREDFKLSISGSYGSANAAATIANSIRSATQNRDVRIIVIRNGGQGPLEGVDPETLIKLALDFPETVAKQPVPVEAETDSYDSLDGGASSLLPAQRAFVRKLFADYRNMLDYAGDLAFVKSHTADFLQLKDPKGSRIDWSNFVDLDHNALEDAARQARSHLQQLEAAAADCVSTKNACSEQLVPASNVPLMRFVRTFEWEAPVKGESLKKPIYIVLPAANYCKLRTMTGFWKVGGPGPFDVPCANLPRGLDQASNVLSGGFDNFYPDNDGDCTYVFTCVRR